MQNGNSVEKFLDLEAAGPTDPESEDEGGFSDFIASESDEDESQPKRARVDLVPAPGPDDGVRRGPSPIDKRCRGWCFTINNYTDSDERLLVQFFDDNPKCEYLIFGREVGENGTPHLQGYLYCENARSGSAIRHAIGDRGHWEAAKASPTQNKAYCSKQATPSNPVVELGRLPVQGKCKPLTQVVKDQCSGVNVSDYIRDGRFDDAATWVRHFKGLAALRFETSVPRSPSNPVTVYWCYGPTGSGKSRWAHETFPGAYYHPQAGKWFDGYKGESVVIFDDFRPCNELAYNWLLKVCDIYPMKVPIKGAMAELCATTIVFTTPEKPENTFVLQEDIGQLLRRIGPNIKRFGTSTMEAQEAQLNTNVFGN